MKTIQNYKNHMQIDWGRLFIATVLLIITLSLLFMVINDAIIGFKTPGFHRISLLSYGILVLVLVACRTMVLKLRMYATTLQDRIIRQEVNFRYYVATGTILAESLSMPQIVALRFAGDNEFVELVDQVIKNPSLSNKEIKKSVKNRKGDYSRV